MYLSIAAVIAGFAILVWGADKFVVGASATARNLGVSPLIIGLTVIGFGTSAPEMVVSATAALNGSPSIAVGNALGSNITNIGLVLGLTALVTPLAVRSSTLKREYPVLFAVMLLTYFLLMDYHLGLVDGLILLGSMLGLIALITVIGVRQSKSNVIDPIVAEAESEMPPEMATSRALFWVVVGLVLLMGSSQMLVWGAVNIAKFFGVSELVIGLTIVAIGTSLPELAASISSALKNEHDLALGNVLGSNMFNLLGVMGIPGVMLPHAIDAEALDRDFMVMVALTVLLFITAYGFKGPGRVNRFEGLLLLAGYIAYMVWLFQESVGPIA